MGENTGQQEGEKVSTITWGLRSLSEHTLAKIVGVLIKRAGGSINITKEELDSFNLEDGLNSVPGLDERSFTMTVGSDPNAEE